MPGVVGWHAVGADQVGRIDEPPLGHGSTNTAPVRRLWIAQAGPDLPDRRGGFAVGQGGPITRNLAFGAAWRATRKVSAATGNARGSTGWSLRDPKNTTSIVIGPDRTPGQVLEHAARLPGTP